MAIWSLTKERVDKLLKQIGDKQTEIDELIKLSKEDIWNKDLDDFMEEWNYQLAEEVTRRKKIQGMKRRVSSKLKTQVKPGRKRKGESDDSDFEAKKPRKTPPKKKDGGLLGFVQKKSVPKKNDQKATAKEALKPVEKDIWMDLDGVSDSGAVVPAPKAKTIPTKPPAPAKSKVIQADSDDEPVIPAPARGRAAARKPVKYDMLSDSDAESDGDFDVSKMVKGIGESASTTTVPARPLFSTTAALSRPGSSAGLVARKSIGGRERAVVDGDSADETDYTRLAPASNGTKKVATAKATILSDDDSMDVDLPAPAAVAAAPAPKKRGRLAAAGKAAPKAKAAAAKAPALAKTTKTTGKAAGLKQTTLSSAAKAYAAKQDKGASKAAAKKKRVDSDDEDGDSEVDKIANDILDDDDEDDDLAAQPVVAKVAARPARRAATQKKKAWVVESSDEEEEDEEGDFGGEEEDESLGFEEGDSE